MFGLCCRNYPISHLAQPSDSSMTFHSLCKCGVNAMEKESNPCVYHILFSKCSVPNSNSFILEKMVNDLILM